MGAPQTTGTTIPSSSSPANGSPPPANASASAPATLSGSSGAGTTPSASSSALPSTSASAPPIPANPASGTATSSYPPIDHDHIIGGDAGSQGRVTGGHSLQRGDVQIIPGTESSPNAVGVYKAHVQIRHPATGVWITKVRQNGQPMTNTMFPKNWSEQKIKAEVDAAWASPSKVINGDRWTSVTPSGVKIIGYINTAPHLNRVTAYPDY